MNLSLTRKYFILLRLQMLGVFSLNKMIHKKGESDIAKIVLLFVGLAAAVLVFSGLSYAVSLGPAMLGMYGLLPVADLIIASIIILVLTVLKSNGVLFGLKDHDLVMSLPVTSSIVILSRLSMVYIINLVISAILFIPSIIALIQWGSPTASGLLMYFLAIFFAPLIPMLLSILLGTLVAAIASRFKYKNLVGMILAFGGMAVYFYLIFASDFSFGASNINDAELSMLIGDAASRFYPPAGWLLSAVMDGNWLTFALFALTSLLFLVLYVSVTAKFYQKINTNISSYGKRRNYKLGEIKTASPFMALYKREVKRLTTNVTYALNTCLGPLMTAVLAVVVAVIGVEGVLGFMDPDNLAGLDATEILNAASRFTPIFVIFMVGLYTPASVALSLEGKNRWIMCSLPVSPMTVFRSKIALSLTTMIPPSIIASAALSIALTPDMLSVVFLFVTPVAYSVLLSTFGMFINVKFPKYDWTSEYQLLKGFSASVLITTFGGIIFTILLGLITMFLFWSPILLWTVMSVAIVVPTVILYNLLSKERLFA